MDKLEGELDILTRKIESLEGEIKKENKKAEGNIIPLNEELAQIREDKRNFASKNDFESVENCRRRENNLKFRISAQWNRCSLLKEELTRLKKEKTDLILDLSGENSGSVKLDMSFRISPKAAADTTKPTGTELNLNTASTEDLTPFLEDVYNHYN